LSKSDAKCMGARRGLGQAHRREKGPRLDARSKIGCVKSECRRLEVVAIGFVPRFFRPSVPAVVGGVVAEVRTGQNTKKVALTQNGKGGGVCAADIPWWSWMASGELDTVNRSPPLVPSS